MKKTAIVAACILCLFAAGCGGNTKTEEPAAEVSSVTSEAEEATPEAIETQKFICGGITFEIPGYWTQEEAEDDSYVYSMNKDGELAATLVCRKCTAAPNLSADDNVDAMVSMFDKDEFENFKTDTSMSADGHHIGCCSYDSNEGGQKLKNLVVAFPTGDDMVCMILSENGTAGKEIYDDFYKVIDELKLPKNNFPAESVLECEHEFDGATYQKPGICSKCGEEGGQLVPDFEKLGVVIDLEKGQKADFPTGSDENGQPLPFTVEITDYSIIPPDDFHQNVDGFEWRRAEMVVTMPASAAQSVLNMERIPFGTYGTDYYNCGLYWGSRQFVYTAEGDERDTIADTTAWESLYEPGWELFYTNINWNGEERQIIVRDTQEIENWDDYGVSGNDAIVHFIREMYLPTGYDGLVLGVWDNSLDWSVDSVGYDAFANEYTPEKFRTFRMYAL